MTEKYYICTLIRNDSGFIKQMKNIFSKSLTIAMITGALCGSALTTQGATPDEMERARTIAAQVYIRYNNDKADYLDGKKPSSLAELKSMVAGKENDEALLTQFLNVPVSNDYPNWGKEELAEYWGGKFFDQSNLSNKAADTRNRRIIARINTMDVTKPQATPTETPAEVRAEQPSEDLGAHPQEVTLGTPVETQTPAIDTTGVSEETIRDTRESSGSNTWLYIVLLIILVGVVIALVVYAMKAMRNQNNDGNNPAPKQSQPQYDDDYRSPSSGVRQAAPMTAAAATSAEIDTLRRQVADLRRAENDARLHSEQLAARVGALQLEVQRLAEENAGLRAARPVTPVTPAPAPVNPAPVAASPVSAAPVSPAPVAPAPVTPRPAPGVPGSYALDDEPIRPRMAAPASNERVIYLGRANRQKIFVRADKQIVNGKTVYRLVTTNGITGSFTVEPDPVIVGWVGLDPETALFGASEVATFANASSFTRIVTDSAGTAIFEDGCWKVLRPAAVHLE